MSLIYHWGVSGAVRPVVYLSFMETFPDNPNSLAGWLERCEADLMHPDLVGRRLEAQGWPRYQAAVLVADYRRRFNEHPLGYSVLLVSTGVAALAAGTAGHELVNGLDHPVNRDHLAAWVSILICALPFAGWSHQWAGRVDREDVVAVWSRPRRQLGLALVWGCGIVGGLRLAIYACRLVAYLLNAPGATGYSFAAGALNVAISIGIALPLGLWAFRFLHRFDFEDPTAPPRWRRRPDSSSPDTPRREGPDPADPRVSPSSGARSGTVWGWRGAS